MENPIKMDDLGGFPIFLETPKFTRTLKLTASLAPKTWDGWKTNCFPIGAKGLQYFQGRKVSFREGNGFV